MNFIKDCITFFQAGGIFMYPLAACSILLCSHHLPHVQHEAGGESPRTGWCAPWNSTWQGGLDRRELEERALASRSVLGRLVLETLNSRMEDEASMKEMIQVKAREEFVTLQAGLPLLDMIVMIAPMFGILGTASGLVEIFSVFGMDESHGQIAQGIARR